MGTSNSYSAPPSWGDLKADVTRDAKTGTLSTDTKRDILQSFIEHNGGAGAIARGGGAGGSGGSVAKGTAARAIGGRVGGFIADVGRVGLDQALRNAGWDDLIGSPVQEVLNALLDRIGGSSSRIDDVDARMALARLQEKYFSTAASSEELNELLAAQVDRIDVVLQDFFGFYLFEVFCRVFFERLVQRVGETRAHSFLSQIADFINATLANRASGRDVTTIDWAGQEGGEIIADIMETTLRVFGG